MTHATAFAIIGSLVLWSILMFGFGFDEGRLWERTRRLRADVDAAVKKLKQAEARHGG
jgi:hypothetical protein